MHPSTPILVLAVSLLSIADTVAAQRGRGRPEEITSRLGCYFVETKLPPPDGEKAADLETVGYVKESAAAGKLSLLYVYDQSFDQRKHELFERTLFRNEEVGVAMRPFRSAKINVQLDAEGRYRYGKQTPLFVAFDTQGKKVGEVSLHGYKAGSNQLVKLMEKAAAAEVKPSLQAFIKEYRGLVNDLTVLLGRRRTLMERMRRLDDEKPADRRKRVDLEKEAAELEAEEQKILATEKELLEQAKVPSRDPDAKRMGDREGR